MKLQKHITKKGTKYFKWEIILPAEAVEKAGFEEGDELTVESKKGEIKLVKR
jgi:antitoxin component of MazEF toxin-antitoxin module